MTGLPTATVKLVDGTGTFPTDISTSVRLREGVIVSNYGRGDEFSQVQPAQLELTLDNIAGAFSTGAGAIVPGTKVRYSLTSGSTKDRFTGRISGCALGWPTGGQSFSTLKVTAADLLADLARRPMRSMLEEEILVDGPAAYYTLGDPSGSTTATDTSGNAGPQLTIGGTGTPVDFGGGTGPADDLPAAEFSAGQFLQELSGQTAWVPAGGAAFSIEVFGAMTVDNVEILRIFEADGAHQVVSIILDLSGHARFTLDGVGTIIGSVDLADDEAHELGMKYDGTTFTAYVDGQVVGTDSTGSPSGNPGVLLYVGGTPVDPGVNGSLSHLGFWTSALPDARFAQHAAVLTSFAEATDARLSRLAGYVGQTATTTGGSGQAMSPQATSGGSVLDAMQTVAIAEGGFVYADGSGALRMQGRRYRAQKTTATVTLGETEAGADTSPSLDTQQFVNQVTVTRPGGSPQIVQDALLVSDRTTPVYAASLDLAVDTDASALSAAHFLLVTHDAAGVRIGSVLLDPGTSTVAATIFGLQLGDRLKLSALPSQMFAGAGDYTVEGWTEFVGEDGWTLDVSLLPWQLVQAWVLGDATYGQLGVTTRLGY